MPRGRQGQKRPGDTIGVAVMVAKIATEEIEDILPSKRREGGLKGSKSRAASLTHTKRTEIAKKAAEARWDRIQGIQ